MNVLVIPEDSISDQYMLRPIISAMFANLGQNQVKVRVCQDRLGGYGEALKPARIAQIVKANPMVDLFLECIDRDANESRQGILHRIEDHIRDT